MRRCTDPGGITKGYGDLRKGRHSAVGREYLVTSVCHERHAVFGHDPNVHQLIAEIEQCETIGDVRWLAWVIMPDHFHGLLSLRGERSLPDVMRRLKGRSARAIGGPVWQRGFHDHALRQEEDRAEIARYVIGNPVRSGLAESLRDYPYWYCCWFDGDDDPDVLLEHQ